MADASTLNLYSAKEVQMIVRENSSLPVEVRVHLGEQYRQSQQVADAFQELRHLEQEHFLGIPLVDHSIIGDDAHYSYADRGLL